jgi:hypothetical protein
MTKLVEGFLLGLANGASCLATCAPVLFPYLVGEGRSVRQSVLPVLNFLAGRLTGYLIFAALAWEAGSWIRSAPRSGLIFGINYVAMAFVLGLYGFSSPAGACGARGIGGVAAALTSRRPAALPALMGLLTGLSLCPPFLAAIAGATAQVALASSLLFFLSFFLATSLYVIPFPLAGLLGRAPAIRTTARLAAGIMAIYYGYRGLIMMYGGLQS